MGGYFWRHRYLFCGWFGELREYDKYKAITASDEYKAIYYGKGILEGLE